MLPEGGVTTEAKPNLAHYAITELDSLGKLDWVITQNVDNLHQKAGVPDHKVFELHSNTKWALCLSCSQRYPFEQVKARLDKGKALPDCPACHGILKPDAVFFGEPIPEKVLSEATSRLYNCDLRIVIGSTLIVYPAAYMPIYAVNSGVKLVIINLNFTPIDRQATVLIRAKAGETMSELLKQLREKVGG